MNNIFSFVIISYNRCSDTILALKNIIGLENYKSYRKEIIILNNFSTEDYSPLEIEIRKRSHEADIVYLNHKVNLGVAGGRNFAYKKAKGDYILFLDDDAEILTPNTIALIVNKFLSSPQLKIIGFAQKFLDGSFSNPIKRNFLNQSEEIETYFFWGYGHVIRAGLFDEVGYYSDDFFYGMEEYELSYLTLDAGYKLLFMPQIIVLHKVNKKGREAQITTWGRMFQNKTLLAFKYLPFLYFITHFLMWSTFYLFKSRMKVKQYFSNVKMLFERLKQIKRKPLKKETIKYMKTIHARLTY